MIFFPLFMKNKMYNEQTHRGIVLMVEQRSPKPTVVSSSLTAPANKTYYILNRGIVQLVEQRSPKPQVVSSSLTAPASHSKL